MCSVARPSARAWQIRKELYIVDEEQKHVQFAKMFLVGWDNSLTNDQVTGEVVRRRAVELVINDIVIDEAECGLPINYSDLT